MGQLLTRLDDRLHEQIKQLAEAEGRSVNALVTDLLDAYAHRDDRTKVRAGLARRGRLAAIPPTTAPVADRGDVIEATRGSGSAASKALDEARGEW